MANPAEKPDPEPSTPKLEPEDEEIHELEEEEEDDDTSKPKTREDGIADRIRVESLFRRMRTAPVPVRVHDVIVKGNEKTKDHVIEAEVDVVRQATTLQELLEASQVANFNLRSLDIFDSINITLDSGPPELPGTTNVVIDVVETKNLLTAQLGTFTKSEARSSSLEGSLKYKNLFGYGDIWDGSLAYGCDNSAEVGFGMYLPRFRGRPTPFTSRVYLSTQDWLKHSSYKEHDLGLSLGLLSSKYHDLSYNIAWRNLIDPSQMASKTIRRQIGHNLFSNLKYTFKYDQRNSSLRPTRGYSFISTSQIGGLAPDSRTLRFLRQEIDLRYAVPLGFYRAALNFGVAGGITFPWGSGYKSRASSVPERFFLGGNISPVCSLGGPSALWGFKTRGMGPNEPRREVQDDQSDGTYERDFVGGDVAVTAFADLSFDFPLKWFRDRGIHGHVFACAGNMAELSENKYRNFAVPKLFETFRSSVGAGIVIPTSLFRMEFSSGSLERCLGHVSQALKRVEQRIREILVLYAIQLNGESRGRAFELRANAEDVELLLMEESKGWTTSCIPKSKSVNSVHECSICLEDHIRDEEAIELQDCFHVFHKTCLWRWIWTKSICPLCRHPIYATKRPKC